MIFQIVRDVPLRLRLRAETTSFSNEKGLAIEEALEKHHFILKARSNYKNGSLLIEYKEGHREDVLDSIRALHTDELTDLNSGERYEHRKLAQDFERKMLRILTKRYLIKTLVPKPIRSVFIWKKASKYFGSGLEKLSQGKLTVEVLDASAIGISLLQRQYSTAGSIMFFLSISELLEDYTTQRAKLELSESLAIHVDKVWKKTEEGSELVSLDSIVPGDIVTVKMGHTIPVDGHVVKGIASVDEATMTGESIPVPKGEGSFVFAGTVIADGSLDILVKGVAKDTRIHKIVELIDTAENLKASVQSKAERLADKIVPYSFLTAFGVYAFGGNVIKAMSVLMVDYSCALKLSTPISVLSALRQAAEQKIMVKGGRYLEEFAAADTIVFDKTGTLTKASPSVAEIIAFPPYTRESFLRDAACIEEHFPHSVAKAIVNEADKEGIEHEERHAEVKYIVAHGIKTELDGQEVNIGSHHFIFEDEKTELTAEQEKMIETYAQNYSIIFMAVNGKLVGFICIDDPPRDEAKAALDGLREKGFNEIRIITGDGERAAKSIAEQLDIKRYHHQVLPDEKLDIVKAIKEERKHLIMVGDGINDSPALAEANVSVAMKDASDLAREVADIVILESDLNRLNYIRTLSKALMERIHSNFRWIVGINTALIGFGALGLMSPTTTALLHNSSTFVISLRSAGAYKH